MKQLISIYCEGMEIKAAVLAKEKDGIRIVKTVSVTSNQFSSSVPAAEQSFDLSMDGFDDGISLDSGGGGASGSGHDASELAKAFDGIKLAESDFIPVLTEPVLSYHMYEGPKHKDRKKLFNAIIDEIRDIKGVNLSADNLGYVEHPNGNLLVGFIEDGIPCVDQINSLASYNKRRYYKIPTLKSAELSLQYLVSKTNKFYPEDYTLIIYTGPDSSKLIFLEGQKLKHIGSTLDIGTKNLHTYDVYFSKILLEMENGGIPRLDNVVLCGEDNSENLVLSFYGTFPEANIIHLKFDSFITKDLTQEESEKLSSLAIPIAAAYEYFDELDKKYQGLTLLPKNIRENQKMLQFGWHSYALFPLIFLAAFFFTTTILNKSKEISKLDLEINRLTQLQIKNQAILDQMTQLNVKINNFGRTQSILDSATAGSEVWGKNFEKMSGFMERRRSFWISKLTTQKEQIVLNGYSLSRKALTEFAEYNNTSLLQNILYEPLRKNNAYSFVLSFNIEDKQVK